MKRQIRGAAFAAAPFLIASPVYAQYAYSAPRNAVVDAGGAKSIEVEAGAGILRVEGKPGLKFSEGPNQVDLTVPHTVTCRDAGQ